MNLLQRVKRLESAFMQAPTITEDERWRLNQLSQMEMDNPDYDVIEHLELEFKTNPGISFEQHLREVIEE